MHIDEMGDKIANIDICILANGEAECVFSLIMPSWCRRDNHWNLEVNTSGNADLTMINKCSLCVTYSNNIIKPQDTYFRYLNVE